MVGTETVAVAVELVTVKLEPPLILYVKIYGGLVVLGAVAELDVAVKVIVGEVAFWQTEISPEIVAVGNGLIVNVLEDVVLPHSFVTVKEIV